MLPRSCVALDAATGSVQAAVSPRANTRGSVCKCSRNGNRFRGWPHGQCDQGLGVRSPTSILAGRPLQLCLSAQAQSGTTAASAVQQAAVEVTVEKAGPNSRRVYAAIDIGAPVGIVWDALTDYEGLGSFIPGLAENRCLQRTDGGARLLQVGEQDVAMGFKFRARVVLDIGEHMHGVRPQLLSDKRVSDGCFPQPRLQRAPDSAQRDITFTLVEGDFQAFNGVWRMQQRQSSGPTPAARLAYALYVRPQAWLPVRLIQSRIEGEVVANLRAVQQHAERLHKGSLMQKR